MDGWNSKRIYLDFITYYLHDLDSIPGIGRFFLYRKVNILDSLGNVVLLCHILFFVLGALGWLGQLS